MATIGKAFDMLSICKTSNDFNSSLLKLIKLFTFSFLPNNIDYLPNLHLVYHND